MLRSIALWGCLAACAAVDTLHVDAAQTLSPMSRSRLGLNTITWFDSDRYHPRTRTLAQAVTELGLGTMRYGCNLEVWSTPPYDAPRPTPARRGDPGYPWDNPALYQADGSYQPNLVMPFDEFMATARAAGAQPCVMVTSQTWMNPGRARAVLGRDELIAAAAGLVRYANVTKGWGVRWWEIGNETSLENSLGAAGAQSAMVYAQDVRDFSRAMKAVDPSIRIGADDFNDLDRARLETLLTTSLADLDVIVTHVYCTYLGGYADFLRWPADPSGVRAIDARLAALPAPDRDRIRIAVTETGATATFSDSERNDTWHALATFENVGALLAIPRVEFCLHWTAHWFHDDGLWATALTDAGNQPTPVGRAMGIWGRFVRARMVAATSDASAVRIFTFADDGGATLFLMNKDGSDRPIDVRFDQALPTGNRRYEFRGASAGDPAPTWAELAPLTVSANGFTTTLPPFSLTVVDLGQAPPSSLSAVQAAYGRDANVPATADLNRDGRVDAVDVGAATRSPGH